MLGGRVKSIQTLIIPIAGYTLISTNAWECLIDQLVKHYKVKDQDELFDKVIDKVGSEILYTPKEYSGNEFDELMDEGLIDLDKVILQKELDKAFKDVVSHIKERNEEV